MGNPSITQNPRPSDPSLRDVLDALRREIMLTLNCHHLGTIQSFNPTLQTATVTINYKKSVYKNNPKTGVYGVVQIDYPLLIDCPVIVLGGGPFKLTFPITNGDQCLVLFNDRSIDGWFQSGQTGPLTSPRAHSFADGIVLVGLSPSNAPIKAYDATHAGLFNGKTTVSITSSLVRIANQQTTLNTLLQSLVTQVSNLVTATAGITVLGVTSGAGTSGVPVNATTITAIGNQLTQIGQNIAGLLE